MVQFSQMKLVCRQRLANKAFTCRLAHLDLAVSFVRKPLGLVESQETFICVLLGSCGSLCRMAPAAVASHILRALSLLSQLICEKVEPSKRGFALVFMYLGRVVSGSHSLWRLLANEAAIPGAVTSQWSYAWGPSLKRSAATHYGR